MILGNNSYVGVGCKVRFPDEGAIHIGNYTSIGEDVKFICSGEHEHRSVSQYPLHEKLSYANAMPNRYSKGTIVIGSDVWVGDDVIILSGVIIGDGAIIGAGEVVRDDVPPYHILAGGVLTKRFDDGIIEALLRSKWWDWSDGKVQENALMLSDPRMLDRFIEEVY